MNPKIQDQLLDAALTHVVFDGWTDQTLAQAGTDLGMNADQVRDAFPKGAIDLAKAYHLRGDGQMLNRMKSGELADLRYSEKVAAAVRFRLESVGDKELARRGTTLFSLPQHMADGAGLIWGTADAIWKQLGDTSDDLNWYSKRAILSGVYSATLLFWLGDTSPNDQATWQFLDRRIGDVMRFEKFKSRVRENPALKPLVKLQDALFGRVRAPSQDPRPDYPGYRPPSDQ